MAARRPLALVAGEPKELPVGDTLVGGGAAALVEVDINLGATPARAGSFVISGLSGLVIRTPVRLTHQLGTLPDEFQFEGVHAAGVVTSATQVTVQWRASGPVMGTFKFLYEFGPITLPALSWSDDSVEIGTPQSGTIVGASSGFAITAANLPTGWTINGTAGTWSYDGTGVATTAAATLTAVLATAANSPRVSNVPITVAASAISNVNIVGKGDSIMKGTVYGSEPGAIEQMGLTGTGTITVTNLGVFSSRATTHLTEIESGQLASYYNAGRPCVMEWQGGTNDIGEFATGTPGMASATLYSYATAGARLAKAMGWFTIGRTILPRADAFMTAPKQNERTAYNILLAANAEGAFDGIVDLRVDARVGDSSGIAANATDMPDAIHPAGVVQTYMGTTNLKAVFQAQAVKAARASRVITTAFAASPTYGAGKFGLAMLSGGTFINTPPVPLDLTPRPLTFECWVKPAATTQQGILGKLDNPGGTPQFLVGIDASGKYYANVSNGAAIITTTVSAVIGTWAYLRFIITATGAKLEVDGANQVATSTVISSTGTRAVRYQTLDATHGVADFTGAICGFASWDGDRSGVANPTGHLALNTANLRAYYPLEGHLLGWN
jgi:hypothetical protein